MASSIYTSFDSDKAVLSSNKNFEWTEHDRSERVNSCYVLVRIYM